MIIKKVTHGSNTGYAIWIESSKEFSPMFKSWAEAIKMALRVGL